MRFFTHVYTGALYGRSSPLPLFLELSRVRSLSGISNHMCIMSRNNSKVDLAEYPNISGFLESTSGRFVDDVREKAENGKESRLTHLEGILSEVDLDQECFNEWLNEKFKRTLSELDLLFILRRHFEYDIQLHKSPSGMKKDFDLYFESEDKRIWIEVKTPDWLKENGGWVGWERASRKIRNYITTPRPKSETKFEQMGDLSTDSDVVVLGIYENIPDVQEMMIDRYFDEYSENWGEYIDGLLTFHSGRTEQIHHQTEYRPINEDISHLLEPPDCCE